jgi:hypothetical protein
VTILPESDSRGSVPSRSAGASGTRLAPVVPGAPDPPGDRPDPGADAARSPRSVLAAALTGAGPAPDRPGFDTVGSRQGRMHSWVLGWAHWFDPQDPRTLYPMDEDGGLAVRRIAEAVVEVLLEHRSVEQVRRWVSREVFRSLSTPAESGRARRFAARSMLRSLRLHHPAADAVESTVLIQEGERVRAVALRFDRCVSPPASARQTEPARLDWLCTAIQFG